MNEFQVKYGAAYARRRHPQAPRCHLRVVGFPCNQFGLQEPATNEELMNGLKYVRPGHGFVPSFDITSKIEVNGRNENKVFTFLKSRCAPPRDIIANHTHLLWTPIKSNDVAWNFQKWLIDSEGHPHRRYESEYTPEMMEGDIVDQIELCVRKSVKRGSVADARERNGKTSANKSEKKEKYRYKNRRC